jgi:hypothetical protein
VTTLPDRAELGASIPLPGDLPATDDTAHIALRDSLKRLAAESDRDIDWTTYKVREHEGVISDRATGMGHEGRLLRATVMTEAKA